MSGKKAKIGFCGKPVGSHINLNEIAIDRKKDKARFIEEKAQAYIKKGHNRGVALTLAKLAYKNYRKEN